MAETITIPSPSVFLRASPEPPQSLSHLPESKHERKKAPAKKKKPAPASNKSQESSAIAKPKQSKSRNGCVTCKAKRLKCDETKPSCQQCKKRNVDCGGYKKDFKWRPFEETNVATHIAKQKKASPPPTFRTLDEQNLDSNVDTSHSPPPTTSPDEMLAISSSFAQQVFVPPEDEPSLDSALQGGRRSSTTRLTPSESPQAHTAEERENVISSLNEEGQQMSERAAPDESFLQLLADETIQESLDPSSSSAPDFIEFNVDNINFMQEFLQIHTPPDDEADPSPVEDAENIVRPQSTTVLDYDAWALRLASRPLYEDDEPKKTGTDIFTGPFTYLYEQPSFSQSSPEMLMLRFDRLTCGILSVKDGPNENPWRTLIWPMAQTSPALYHAISSMTAFHSSRDIPALRVAGHEHKSASVQNLLEGIDAGSMNLDTAIATTLALAFAECWDQHIASGNDHIKGARTMINIALAQHSQVALSGINLARLKFLSNAWVYLDVIARITTVDPDESDDYDKLYCLYSTPAEPDTAGFGIDFGMPIDAQLDPLMGCASTLFPLIGRVANLVRRVCRSESNSPPMITQAMELKLLLETWDPPAFIEPPEDPTSSVQHSVQTAEAYRWATLLYLHQALPEIPGMSSAEMAKKVLVFLATVPLASRCVIVHIYPLMMAGCEAVAAEDRQWVRDRWVAMSQRMRIGLLEKCLEVTEEVWQRRDKYERQPVRRRAFMSAADMQARRASRPNISQRGSFFDNSAPGISRRMTSEDIGSSDSGMSSIGSRDTMSGTMDPMFTVRGGLHWVGVMTDWGWEVLLG
ncbi:hypothetical protein MBLNU459_g1776t1 [Dothideomycetes sp. NU459]